MKTLIPVLKLTKEDTFPPMSSFIRSYYYLYVNREKNVN
jgi:hypothetical protein